MSQEIYKIVIFGDGGVGKTTLTKRFISGKFIINTKMTIGSEFYLKEVDIHGRKVKLQIWDFAGEERFRYLLPTYLRGAKGAIFMYDTTRYKSLEDLDGWLKSLDLGNGSLKEMPVLMIGGKTDLIEDRVIDAKKAKNIAIKKGFADFLECSSKTGENIDEIFLKLASIVIGTEERKSTKILA